MPSKVPRPGPVAVRSAGAVSRHERKADGALLVNDCSTWKPGINFHQISQQHRRVSNIREADTFQPNVFLRFSEIGQT